MQDAVNTLSRKLKLIVTTEVKESRRFGTLETSTGIPAATWRTWWVRGSTPSGALLEGVAKVWPHYAYWLLTGTCDNDTGHIAPGGPASPMRAELFQITLKLCNPDLTDVQKKILLNSQAFVQEQIKKS